MADEPEEQPKIDMATVMIDGYHVWERSEPVAGLIYYLTLRWPDASAMEIRAHVLQYTLVKLVAWLQPPSDETGEKKEPWQE